MFVRQKHIFLALIASFALQFAVAQEDLTDVIDRCEKSVVRIETKSGDGDSLGSGFVIDGKGTMITNCHVLAGAQSAKVVFADNTSGEIVGTLLVDQARDIVVCRISIQQRPAITLSTQLPRKGEAVVALGAPHGLSFTATRGIISAVRSAEEMGKDMGDTSLKGTWVQVDAALSPGNSGGPLINAQGQVVAMSTLASRGSAQNLNFGISGEDIRQAIQTAMSSPVVPLGVGVAKIRSKESSSGGRGGGRDSILTRRNIPPDVFAKYLQDCKEAYTQLTRDLRKEAGRLELRTKEMAKGETFIPPNLDNDGADIIRIRTPYQKSTRWFFRSESIKDREISRQESRVREVNKLKSEVKSADDPTSIYKLAWNFGPKLDTRRNNTIGFLTEAIVLHAGNEHEALIIYEDSPYLMWIDSTAGLTLGEQVTPRPFYVNGTATATTKSGSVAVTVLQAITEEELKSGFKVPKNAGGAEEGLGLGSGSEVAGGYRQWNDKSGKFSIEAVLLSTDGKKARLKRRDGKVIEVTIANLSAADAKYLKDF